MPNPVEFTEEYETELTRQNLENLCKFFIKLNRDDDWENPQVYHITEYFPYDNSPIPLRQYDLRNIKMSIENDGMAYCDDAEGILEEYMEKNSPLRIQTIIIDDVMMISHIENVVTISLADGYIKIEY